LNLTVKEQQSDATVQSCSFANKSVGDGDICVLFLDDEPGIRRQRPSGCSGILITGNSFGLD